MNLDKLTRSIETLNERPPRVIETYHIICGALILANIVVVCLFLMTGANPIKISKKMNSDTTYYKYERDNELHK